MLTVTGTGRGARRPPRRAASRPRGAPRRRRRRAAGPGTPRRRGARAGPPRAGACRIACAAATSTSSPVLWPWVSLTRLKWSRSSIAIESGCPWRRAAETMPGQLGQDRAAVGEPGERVLAQQRLEPRALARRAPAAGPWCARRPRRGSGPRRRRPARPGSPGCPGAPVERSLGRQPGPLDHHDRGRVGDRVGLDVADEVAAALGVRSARRPAPTRGSAASACAGSSTSATSWPASPSTRAIRRRLGVRAWATGPAFVLLRTPAHRPEARTIRPDVSDSARRIVRARRGASARSARRRSRSAARRGCAR